MFLISVKHSNQKWVPMVSSLAIDEHYGQVKKQESYSLSILKFTKVVPFMQVLKKFLRDIHKHFSP